MKAPKCKLCQKEHYGPCYVRDDTPAPKRDNVAAAKAAGRTDRKRLLLRHDAGHETNLRPIPGQELATDKARTAQGDAPSGEVGTRKVGRPKTEAGPQFDKREYQRKYMVAYRAKLKSGKGK